jgi:hypothetical protein
MKGFIIAILIIFCSCARRPSQQTGERHPAGNERDKGFIINVVDDTFKVIKSFKSVNKPSLVSGGVVYRGEDGRQHVLLNMGLDITR